LIFKGSTKSFRLPNVKVSVLLDNVLQRCSWGCKKNFHFLLKKIFNAGTGMWRGYPNPSGTGMGFNFSSPLGMGRVTGKYMRIGYGDGEGKPRLHPCPIAMPTCISARAQKSELKTHKSAFYYKFSQQIFLHIYQI